MLPTIRTFALCALLGCTPALAADLFDKSDVMIPMRDGVRLHTVVFTPKTRAGPLPILFERTPYSSPSDERGATASFESLIEDGYILVFQDFGARQN